LSREQKPELEEENLSLVRKWAGRRRAYGVIAGASLAFAPVLLSELDHPIFITDDVSVAILGAIVLILYSIFRNSTSLNGLKRHTNLFAALLILAYAIKFVWLFVEIGDPDASGDDMSAIFFLAVIIANRFL
jgi:hypothetical protein